MKVYIQNLPGAVIILCMMNACTPPTTRPVTNDEAHPDLYFVRGYHSDNDPCKLTGETAFTNQFLDDAADLVTCPSGGDAAAELVSTGQARVVAQTRGYTLYSVRKR